MEYETYDWYNGQVAVAKTETGATEKADFRIPSSQHELVSRCSAQLENNDFKPNQCKWYQKASGRDERGKERCMYDKWGIMCDKIVNYDGKGIN